VGTRRSRISVRFICHGSELSAAQRPKSVSVLPLLCSLFPSSRRSAIRLVAGHHADSLDPSELLARRERRRERNPIQTRASSRSARRRSQRDHRRPISVACQRCASGGLSAAIADGDIPREVRSTRERAKKGESASRERCGSSCGTATGFSSRRRRRSGAFESRDADAINRARDVARTRALGRRWSSDGDSSSPESIDLVAGVTFDPPPGGCSCILETSVAFRGSARSLSRDGKSVPRGP